MYQHEELITRLGRESAIPSRHRIRDFAALMVAAGIAVGSFGLLAFHIMGWPIRADYMAVIFTTTVMAKQAVPLLILLSTLPIALSLGRPDASPRLWPALICLMIFPLLFFSAISTQSWSELAFRPSLLRCLVSIPVLALPLTLAQLWSLRQDAVTRPWVAGAMAGFAAGAGATVIYALTCTEDSPGFFALWYLLGILASGGIGAGAGRVLLRW
ncbi:DUF1109 domain-containing protein [Alphaproteobacteria bacterium LSUCC0684]